MEILLVSKSMLIALILTCNVVMAVELNFVRHGQPTNTTALEGETATFYCLFKDDLINSGKSYIVHWEVFLHSGSKFLTKGRDEVYDENKYNVTTGSTLEMSTLTITNVTISDQRFYRCSIHEYGRSLSKSREAYLTVLPKPAFQQMPSSNAVDRGQNLTLYCRLQNVDNSNFQLKWFGYGELISRNYDVVIASAYSFSDEISVLGKKNSGKYDLAIADIKRSGDFYCEVYFIVTSRVILQSDIASILVRNPRQSNKQPLQAISIVAVVVPIFVIITVCTITVCVVNVRLKSREATSNVLRQGVIDEPQRNLDTNSGQVDIEKYREISDVKNTKFEEVKSISLDSAASGDTQPTDDLTKPKIDVAYAYVCKRRPSTETRTAGLTSTANDGLEKKSRNVEGLLYADLDLQSNVGRPQTVCSSSFEDDASVMYAELQARDTNP